MLQDFQQAQEFLFTKIPTQTQVKHQGNFGLQRTIELLKLLDSPQNKLKVIHLAGTSGKGSTAYVISLLLKSLGFKVGLHVSPHLVDIRERAQINNELISQEKFVLYLNQIMPAIQQISQTKYGSPTYFEITTTLAFYIAYKEGVDYLVSETGVGGLYDATNCVDNPNKVAVITKIGLDHTKILGNTIGKIALQKAEIIHQNNLVISAWQTTSARKVIEKIANERHARLLYVKKDKNFRVLSTTAQTTTLALHLEGARLDNLELSLLGEYQAENCAVAVTAVYQFLKRDNITFPHGEWEHKVRKALKHAHFAGRMDIKTIQGKTVILDGAHNPQKMRSFISSVKQIFPDQKFNFLIAFKKDKDYSKMLKVLLPQADKIYVTNFFVPKQDWVSISTDTTQIGQTLEKLGFHNFEIIPDTGQAYEKALHTEGNLVITGSLYLLSDVYQGLK